VTYGISWPELSLALVPKDMMDLVIGKVSLVDVSVDYSKEEGEREEQTFEDRQCWEALW
jgi:hypothetical protein